MKNKQKGFTLIELLVVVLIIGILAAIAVPQYQKAVEKSRSAEALITLKAFADSVNRYYMEHSTYEGITADNLDIELPKSKDFVFSVWEGDTSTTSAHIYAARTIGGAGSVSKGTNGWADIDFGTDSNSIRYRVDLGLTKGAVTGRSCNALGYYDCSAFCGKKDYCAF